MITTRRQFSWTPLQEGRLEQVLEILRELEDYKPLTLRQVYYQLVGKGLIENVRSQYIALSRVLKQARIDGFIPWSDIEDRVRAIHKVYGFEDKADYIDYSQRTFLEYYNRSILQDQPVYMEIWIEKDALSSIFTRVAEKYHVPVVVCRGFSSVSFLNDFKERLEQAGDGKRHTMLYFGDFDPSGMEMLESMQITLEDEMGVPGVEFKRIALSKVDISRYKLPHNPDALKHSDTRAVKHILAHGELAVELDALRPDVLSEKIKEAIESELDMDKYRAQRVIEKRERRELAELKTKISEFIDETLREEDQ